MEIKVIGLKICIKELVKHDGIQSDKQRSKMSYGKRVTSPREKGSVIMPEYKEERGNTDALSKEKNEMHY